MTKLIELTETRPHHGKTEWQERMIVSETQNKPLFDYIYNFRAPDLGPGRAIVIHGDSPDSVVRLISDMGDFVDIPPGGSMNLSLNREGFSFRFRHLIHLSSEEEVEYDALDTSSRAEYVRDALEQRRLKVNWREVR